MTTTVSLPLLTHSRLTAYQQCPRRHYYAYEVGLRKADTGKALRLGSAYHGGLEAMDLAGGNKQAGIDAIRANYAVVPDGYDAQDWMVEAVECEMLFCGHCNRWRDERYEVVATEQVFDLPLVNPDTGYASRSFRLAGKIDRIVRMGDGRLMLQEYKTTGMSIDPDGDYWSKLRIDGQITLYMHAARRLGYDVDGVVYDVARKPSIRPRLVKGERETPTIYGMRLAADLVERPDFYFQRREITRLKLDMDEFERDLWHLTSTIARDRRAGRWVRTPSSCTSPYPCQYQRPCHGGWDIDQPLPDGWTVVTNVNPELGEPTDDND